MQETTSGTADFRAFFERAGGLCLALAPDLTIVAVSDAYTRAMMTTRAGLIGRSIFDVLPDDPAAEAALALCRSLERVRELKRPDVVTAQKYAAARPITEGGGVEERYWSAVNTPVLDGNGELSWIIHRVEDVTELERLRRDLATREDLLREQTRKTEQLRAVQHALARRVDELNTRQGEAGQRAEQRAIGDKAAAIATVTGSIAHDFNSLLGAIIGNLELLCGGDGAPPARELVEEALASALRGAELGQRLLAFARRQQLQPAVLDVNPLINALAQRLAGELGDGLEVSLQLLPELWPVMADPAVLEESLSHLVANAREAMTGGGRLIVGTRNGHLDADYAAEHPAVAPGDYVIIEVSDTGRGMARAVASRALEPFFTTKERGAGAGLGLSMVEGFCAQSGGHVDVASERGVGTTVRLYFPRHGGGAATIHRLPARGAARGGDETVLVVEDDGAMRRIVCRQLYQLGYRVLEAEHAAAALRLLETENVAVLFTDIVTPGSIDGIALARTAASRWPDLKILLTSGFPQAARDGHGEVNGFRLLPKPYRREELARTLREMLSENGAATPGATA
jgi:signal transduction histidine kinase/ActR/RegA family two-component response regulator